MTGPLLTIEDLKVTFSTRNGPVDAIKGVSLSLSAGETLGIVGESGSGKSVTAFSVMQLLDRAGRSPAGGSPSVGRTSPTPRGGCCNRCAAPRCR